MSNYSNENIRKITKLTLHDLLHLVQNRENNGVYSIWCRVPGQNILTFNIIVYLMNVPNIMDHIFMNPLLKPFKHT